ncbi:peptide ABC transporter substrate-binding protein [Limobrevibacterium gyesilva]|uniref:Peptide ABC transporter substrate-binding protein n=1 Tax=Limobrevibacterium gyesilva TaxID=2991712 RepID=A0AA41YNI2_9PROT|nr:peptide ABC transporter substrate-binding protein [Limobrevibacterium gyesilva]MCW3475627.1 peptide ABC transporter substrate-binding protein [Limobrevibacterium gyesilva]
MKLRAALAAIVMMALPLLNSPAQAKDDLVIGIAQFPSSLHPNIDALVIKAYVLGFVLRPITAFDKDWKNSCLLCTELPTLENGLAKFEDRPDGSKGMAVTITLKPDLKWGDGTPVTSKDVAFTWKLGRDPASGFSNSHSWGRATSLDIVDERTVVLHLDKVRVDYNQWDQILPEHVESPIYAKAGNADEYVKQTAYNRAPTTPGLYDGPYRVADYQSGVQIVLEPNPYWSGTKPGFKRIVLKLIENTAALQANLLSGDVDMVPGEGVGLTIDQVIALRKQNPDKFEYIFKPSLTYEHIDLKIENPILADVRVRRALLYAMDRKTIVQRLFEGMQPVADTWVNPLDPNYAKDVPTYPYDLARAKALLAEAGWKPGSDGICRNGKGERLSLEINTTAGNRLRELTEQVLQNQWKAACIDVTIRNEPARTLFGETLKKRQYTGMIMYGWSSGVGESPRRTLGTDNIPTAANNWGGSNAIAMSDPQLDADIAKAETELDPVKQKQIWTNMQRIYAEQVRVLPLFFRAEPHVVPKWLKGYTPTGHSDASILWSENWHPG